MDIVEAVGRGIAVRLESVRKVYGSAGNGVVALAGVTIGFQRGSFTAVMGPSGSGKSTLLQTAAGLLRPTAGSVVVDNSELTALSETALAKLRRERIGFVFQAFNLLPALTVEQNVTLPLRLASHSAREVLGLLRESVRAMGQTVVMVTHDPVAASFADRVVFLADGRLVGQLRSPTADAVAERMLRLGAWAERSAQPAWSVAGGAR